MRTLRSLPFGKRIIEVSFMGDGPDYGVGALGIGEYMRPDGTRCERTKKSHPYSYEPYVIFGPAGDVGTASAWTDQMRKEDRPRFDALCVKHFRDCNGPGWSNLPQSNMTAFMRELYGDPRLEVYRLVEFCNTRTEFPEWRVDFSHSAPFLALQAVELAALGAKSSVAAKQKEAELAYRTAREVRDNPLSTREEAVAAQTNARLEFDVAMLAAQRFGKAQLDVVGARAKLFEGTR
jgi:hypothetical protein